MSGELITVISLLIANAGFLYGMWKFLILRIDQKDVEHKKIEAKMWERLDEHKVYIDSNFVEKDMCKVLHNQGSLNTIGLETRITLRMDKLETKFDSMMDLLTTFMKR